ncbi:MAG TPA: hypothetical protein VES20_03175 [Bryobacteraceae bacterium]|nr:hypothetical protein [Bryobacteraceae bacterium]
MATLANIFNQFMGARALEAECASGVAQCDDFRLRSLPNEDIFVWVKRIDNSRVLRQADPKQRVQDWKLIGKASFAGAALVLLLLPTAWNYMAGYELNRLKSQNDLLAKEQARLELTEANIVSARNLDKLAEDFVAPTADQTHYLPAADTSLAMNQRR